MIENFVSVVTLSIQDNTELLHLLKIRFKRTVTWNNHDTKHKNIKLAFTFFDYSKS